MTTPIKLDLDRIPELPLRLNFEKLQDFIDRVNEFQVANSQFVGFEHRTLVVDKAETNLKVAHGLNEKPLDLVQTSIIGSGTITYNYDKFDQDTIDVTTSGPVTVRYYVGTQKAGEAL